MSAADAAALWDRALTYEQFLAQATENRSLWENLYRLARLPAWATAPRPAGTRRYLLAIVEDWCGDASNTVPVLARLADEVEGVELRCLLRDANPEVMDRYLTNGSRSIPIVIVYDEAFRELGHWGPRPSELQAWVLANRGTMPKGELYKETRKWYAKDRGETTLRDLLAIMDREG